MAIELHDGTGQNLRMAMGQHGRIHLKLRLILLLSMLLPLHAHALRVQIRARTHLTLAVEQAGGELEVRGMLVDIRQQPVAGASVTVLVTGSPPPAETHQHHVELTAVTGPDGQLALRVPLQTEAGPLLGPDHLAHVEARYAGGPTLGETTAGLLFDLRKQDATLEIHASPQQLRSDLGDLELAADVHSGEMPLAALEVQWLIDQKPMVMARSDGMGRAVAVLPGTALGEPGPHVVTARLTGDEQVNAAEASLPIELLGAVQVELERAVGKTCTQVGKPLAVNDWCLQGRVRTARQGTWQPVAQAAVTLHIERHLLAALTTDKDGRFLAIVRAEALARLFPPGAVGLVARAQVTQPWHEIGWSPVLSLEIPPPPELSGWLYAIPLVLLVLAALAQRWRRRRQELALQAWREASSAGLPDEHVRSLGPAEPSSRLRGRVLHGETGRPCAAHLILMRVGDPLPVWEFHADDGQFDQADLPPGGAILHVEVDEHLPLRLELDLPHDGLYDQCELLPASCRAVVRGAFNQSVRALTAQPVDWSRETPREVEPRVHGLIRRGHADLRDAVRRVERAVYGRKVAPEDAELAKTALRRVEESQ